MTLNQPQTPPIDARPADVVRAFYAALQRGDAPGALALLSPTLEWTEARTFPYFSGTWHSPDEVLHKLLIPITRDWEVFSPEAYDFIAEGERVASSGNYIGTFKKTGKRMLAPFAHTWTVRAGRITKFGMCVDSAKVLEAMN